MRQTNCHAKLMLPDVRLKGWGYFLPETSVSNAELAERIGTTDDLGESTGITQRHFSAPGHGPSGLAQKASMVALDRAAIGVDELALLVFATTTPDVAFPGSACFCRRTSPRRRSGPWISVHNQPDLWQHSIWPRVSAVCTKPTTGAPRFWLRLRKFSRVVWIFRPRDRKWLLVSVMARRSRCWRQGGRAPDF